MTLNRRFLHSFLLVTASSLLTRPSLAVPSVTGVSGTVEDGNSVVISGSSFGAKSPAQPYLWAPFDADSIAPSSLGLVTSWNEVEHMEYGATQGVGGTGGAVSSDTSGVWTLSVSSNGFAWNDLGQKSYVFRKLKENFDIDGSFNWKIWRMWPAGFGWPNIYASGSNGIVYVEGVDSGGYPLNLGLLTGSPNEWRTEEIVLQSNSALGAADGLFWIYVDGVDAGHLPYTDYMEHTLKLNDGSGLMTQNFVVHGVQANYTMGSADKYWADDVYVDTTWARVMLGDQPTWAASTHREIQIPSAWNNSAVTVTLHQGTFAGGSTAYLYVIDADGAVNANGYRVTLGDSISDTAPPIISDGSPTGSLAAGTTQAVMSVTTNEAATCRFASSAGTSYAAMPDTFSTTGGTSHATTLSGLNDGQSYTRYVRCVDASDNANVADYEISWSVADDTCTPNCAGKCAGPDGCGGTCPDDCVTPETCGGGGTPSECGCTPRTCESAGIINGEAEDGCGGVVRCGLAAEEETAEVTSGCSCRGVPQAPWGALLILFAAILRGARARAQRRG